MFDVFRKYITEKAGLTADEQDRMEALCLQKKLRRKQYLLQEGEVCRNNCFVAQGCLRMYRIDDEGKEHIMRFAVENWWISDKESLNTGRPSRSNIDALEDSVVFLWSKEDYESLMREIPFLASFSERLLARSFDASQNRIYTAISSSAEERYLEFMKAYPDLFSRIPQHMIASYLGITRETLSRIRNQYANK